MYTRLLLESLRRGTRRKLLAVTAVALGTLGATALAEVLLASGDRLAAEMSSYGANLELVPAPGRDTLAAQRLAELRKIFWRNNIVAVAPLYTLRARLTSVPLSRASNRLVGAAGGRPRDMKRRSLTGDGGLRSIGSPPATPRSPSLPSGGEGDAPTPSRSKSFVLVAEMVGTWFDYALEPGWRTGLPATRPTLRVAGRWPRDGAAEAVLGRRLAARLGIAAGGQMQAELGPSGARFTVVGLISSGGEEDEQAFVPLAAVGRLAGQPGRCTRAEVFAMTTPETRNVRDPRLMSAAEYDTWYCTAFPSSIAFQIGQSLPEVRARVVYGVTNATADVLGRLRGVLLALAAVALAGAAVGVTAAMTATVLERRLEAGLLVAIGAARRRVAAFFLSESALLGGLGGLAGGGLGLVAGRLLGSGALGVAVPWMPVLLPCATLLGLALAVLASLVPVSRALGRYPADLLKRATA
ncbi:MAG TPA: FtsX-like permease family protein [Thermoanaerobaculia bacterium]|nr:FtsX-like permease family protein [Thermoanaerobaculia bacterium]